MRTFTVMGCMQAPSMASYPQHHRRPLSSASSSSSTQGAEEQEEEEEGEEGSPYPYPLRLPPQPISIEVGESGSALESPDQKVDASCDGTGAMREPWLRPGGAKSC